MDGLDVVQGERTSPPEIVVAAPLVSTAELRGPGEAWGAPKHARLGFMTRVRFGWRKLQSRADDTERRERASSGIGSAVLATVGTGLCFLLFLRYGGDGWGWNAAMFLLFALVSTARRLKHHGRRTPTPLRTDLRRWLRQHGPTLVMGLGNTTVVLALAAISVLLERRVTPSLDPVVAVLAAAVVIGVLVLYAGFLAGRRIDRAQGA